MLQDYRDYIVNLRNNLIQCGVNVPLSPLETYKEIFYEADRLGQVLWFYSIMSISGSELAIPDFFIPLNNYYKERMRKIVHQEFQDYLKDYKLLSKSAFLSGEGDYSSSKDVTVAEIEVYGENDFIDIFEDNPEEFYGEEEVEKEREVSIAVIHGTMLDDIKAEEEVFVPPTTFVNILEDKKEVHGTFIDESNSFLESLAHPEIAKYAEHGTFLDELDINEYSSRSFIANSENLVDTSCIAEVHGIYLDIEDREESSNNSEVHGIFLDDYESGDKVVSSVNSDGEVHGIFLDDLDKVVSYGVSDSEDEDVHGVFLDDIVIEDDEYGEPEVLLDENGFEIVEEDENIRPDDEDEYWDEGYSEPSEEWEPSQPEVSEPRFNPDTGRPTQGTVGTSISADDDLSDILQKGVNNLLTQGKRALAKGMQKLRDIE